MQNKRERIRGILKTLDSARNVGNSTTESLYYDLLVPFEVADLLDSDSRLKRDYFDTLNDAVSLLDLRDIESEVFEASASECRAFLEKNIYNPETRVIGVGKTAATATVIGHFLNTVDENAGSLFAEQIHLMDKYPWYKFTGGRPAAYEFVNASDPGTFERVKARNLDGRWETEGSMWREADCCLCSGESIIRSLLKGKTYFRNEFNLSDNDVLWSPEVRGCTPSLPQILKKTRTKYFLTTGSKEERSVLADDTFLWRGIDGTGVLTHVLPEESMHEKSPVKVIFENDKELTHKLLHDCSLALTGGEEGPYKETLEILERLRTGLPGIPNVKIGYIKDFFKAAEKKTKDKIVPVWSGELPLKHYRGTYSDDAGTKKLLRNAENAISESELYSVAAILEGITTEYPSEEINVCYDKVLQNEYKSCSEAFETASDNTSIKLSDITEKLGIDVVRASEVGEECGDFAVAEKNFAYIYNSTSFNRDDVAEIKGHVRVFDDETGLELPSQLLSNGNTLVFVHDVPMKGYKVLRTDYVSENTFMPENLPQDKGGFKLHTPIYYITFNKEFELIGVFDKLSKRDILKGKGGNILRAYEDRNADGYKGDIDPFYAEKSWRLDDVRSARLVENGPVRYTVEIVRAFNNSHVTQYISFYEATKRIDFRTEMEWREQDLILKTFFPIDVVSDKAVYDIQFGNIERFTHENTLSDRGKYEVFAHKWVDVSENDYGAAILNDGKYGCSVRGTVCSLTLYNALKKTEGNEECTFTYSLLPHDGDFREGRVNANAYFLNNPLKTVMGTKPSEKSGSWFYGMPENIVLETVKLQFTGEPVIISENMETGEQHVNVSVVLRLYESFGRRSECSINSAFIVSDAFECDMLEYSQKRLERDVLGVKLSFKPYEIKTIKLIISI